jgi:Protein of unknown function (DUF3108)
VRHLWLNRSALIAAASAIIVAALMAPAPAQAQGRLDARYTASLSGLPIGKGAWVVDIANNQFTAAASGMTTGLMRVFASGHGTSASRGHIVGGQPVPTSYASSISSRKRTDDVRMTLANGTVHQFEALPPPSHDSKRVPITAAHRRNIIDPMTASLVRIPGHGNPVTAEVCKRSLPIFDGRMRYNLSLSYKRMEQVKAAKGYEGPVVVCGVSFSPIAGHIRDRAAIKYLAHLHTIEVWFAPIAGTRVLVPFRIAVPTPLGLGVVQATQFVSVPQPVRPTPTSASAQ